MVFARRSTTLLAAIIASCAMVLSLTACTSDNKTVVDGQTTVTSNSAGGVAVFTPSDGITLNQQVPLNKWAKLVPDLAKALADAGLQASDLKKVLMVGGSTRIPAVYDAVKKELNFVVDHLSNNTTDDSGIAIAPDNMTLLVAPVVEADASTRQYGDYVSQNLSTNDVTDEGATSDGESSEDDSSKDDSSNTESDSTASDEQAQAVDRLVSSLKLAKESGMHVVLLGNSIEGYKPDAFVKFSDAQTIGKLQAEKMVSKLKLDKASKDNPKYIEVLLPYTAVDEKGNANDSTFAQEAFRGIWQVLGSYYQKGVVESPSGTLDGKSTENDWQAVAYDAAKEGSTAKVLDKRLAKTDGQSTLTRIDGIITMNDYIASEVVKELDDLGYTGSAADINPQITISGIVGNITGKKDLSRDAVPDPIKSPENDNANDSSSSDDDADEDTSASDKDRDSQWPLVTGYGAYVSNIPSIVNGKQWMTGMEDRQTIATDIAQACAKLNKDEALNSMPSIRNSEVGGVKKIPTISEPLLAVSASNLKSALIDPGYISLADAGL